MFERFTEKARQTVVYAQDEAREHRHNYIGTEHLLLGMLRKEEGVAARVLARLNVTIDEARDEVARIVGQGEELRTGQIPFTPRAKRVLELSSEESLVLGHNHVGTEHILLGLVRENDGLAARILLDLGADADRVRNEVLQTLRITPSPEYEAKMRRAASADCRPRPFATSASTSSRPRVRIEAGLVGVIAAAVGIGILIGWLIWG